MMHAYGEGGEVVIDFGDGIVVAVEVDAACTLHNQLGPAIREAELATVGQARLFTPPMSAAGGTL